MLPGTLFPLPAPSLLKFCFQPHRGHRNFASDEKNANPADYAFALHVAVNSGDMSFRRACLT